MSEGKSLLNGEHGDANNYGGTPSSPKNDTSSRGSQNCTTTPLSPSSLATIDTSSIRHRRTSIAAMAAAEVILHDREVRREGQMHSTSPTFIQDNGLPTAIPKPLIEVPSMESLEADDAVQKRMNSFNNRKGSGASGNPKEENSILQMIHRIISQLPAIAIASVLNFMVGIPFAMLLALTTTVIFCDSYSNS